MLSYVRPIESHFRNFMLEAILAEIVLGNISSLHETMNYIKSTFFYIRYMKSPAKYGVKEPKKAAETLLKVVDGALNMLHKL